MSFTFFSKNKNQQEAANLPEEQPKDTTSDVLVHGNILIGQKSVSKDTAIEMAGQLLVDGGYVMPEYIQAMKEREKMLTTYIGNGIAIPHGVGAAKDKILKSGISVIQYPEGVEFGDGKKAFLVVGIAGKGNEHMKILSNLAEFIMEGDLLKELFATKEKDKLYKAFTSKL